jgi:hypothetical protein
MYREMTNLFGKEDKTQLSPDKTENRGLRLWTGHSKADCREAILGHCSRGQGAREGWGPLSNLAKGLLKLLFTGSSFKAFFIPYYDSCSNP